MNNGRMLIVNRKIVWYNLYIYKILSRFFYFARGFMILKWYKPDYIFEKTGNITPQFLKQHNIKCLYIDLDGTLGRHKIFKTADGVMQWLELMQQSGIQLIITSNNFKKRVQPFAKMINLPYVCFSAKPTPWGFLRARFKTKVRFKNTLVVGDQLFTDILGAHIVGMKAAMVLPIFHEKGLGFDIKRNFEQKYIDLYLEENGEFL